MNDIRHMIIWGNHSATQYPDLHHALVAEQAAMQGLDMNWYSETFIPTVQQRGAAIIEARGRVLCGVGGERCGGPYAELGSGHPGR